MNQRIQELAEQAERLARDELAHLERVHNRLYSPTEDREIYNEKFAQLIVAECIDCLKPLSRNHSMVGAAQDTIREHFGVLE